MFARRSSIITHVVAISVTECVLPRSLRVMLSKQMHRLWRHCHFSLLLPHYGLEGGEEVDAQRDDQVRDATSIALKYGILLERRAAVRNSITSATHGLLAFRRFLCGKALMTYTLTLLDTSKYVQSQQEDINGNIH